MLDAQPELHIGYHIPQIGHEDGYALDVLAQILAGVSPGSRTGRLYRSLVLEKKVALEADAGAMSSLYPNLFLIDATPAQGKASEEVEKALYEEIEKIQAEPPAVEEITRVRNNVDASLIRALRTNMGVARLITSVEHLTGSWRYLLTERERLKAVTAEDVQRVARKYFSPENRTVAELRSKTPESGGPPAPGIPSAQRHEETSAEGK